MNRGTHLQRLRVFRGDHWHRHRGRNLMYGLRCGHPADVYARYAVVPCSNDAQTFLIVVQEGWHVSHRWRDQLAVSARSGRSLTSKPTVVVTTGQIGQILIGIQLAKVLGTETVITAQQEMVLNS